jgi:tetratricopeptide (TPR) repeat protein
MHYEVLKTLGDCHAALDQFDRARAFYREAAGLEPDLIGHQIGLGVLDLLEGNVEDAAKVFESVLQTDPGCPDAVWGMALVHWLQGDFASAAKAGLQCVQLLPDNQQALMGLFQACRKLGDFAPVAKLLELRLQKHPGDTLAMLCQAEIQSAAGQVEAARQSLLMVQALDPACAQARQMLANLRAPAPISPPRPPQPL